MSHGRLPHVVLQRYRNAPCPIPLTDCIYTMIGRTGMLYFSMRTMVVYHMSHLQSAGVAARQANPAGVQRGRAFSQKGSCCVSATDEEMLASSRLLV